VLGARREQADLHSSVRAQRSGALGRRFAHTHQLISRAMAIQPPPAPAVPQQAAPPPSARRSGCFGRGCGFGCSGCLVAVILAVLLIVGGGWWFFAVQASAAVTAPATLIVYNQTVSVNGSPGTAGEALNANDSVKTQTGHAAIQFPDGSYVRMSPNTEVQITKVQLQKAGNLDAVEVAQKAGRTLVNVQHLASGSAFKIDGHSVSAEVRGTQFEVLVRQNNTNLFKVSGGTVSVALCYPGSFMTLSVFSPDGVEHTSRNGASPVTGHIDGQAGHWRAVVHAINVSPGEAFVVALATNAPCTAAQVDDGTI